MIDEYPILAVAAACAHGRDPVAGFERTAGQGKRPADRHRRDAPANGIRVEIEGDDLVVHGIGGPPAGGGTVATLMDHRIAMSATRSRHGHPAAGDCR